MDRFQTIESFVRVAHAGSYTKAARQLGLSRALLSRRIIELEARLGVRLLNRSTRSLSLTAEGRAYLTRCKQVLDDMEAADREIARGVQTPLGGIRVLAPKSFGVTCLSDAMIAFSKLHKQVRVSLSLGDFTFRPADFVEAGFDLAIRIADIRDSTVLARRITTLKSLLVASPDFIVRSGSPTNVSQLSNYPCLAHLGSDEHDRVWTFAGQRGGASIRVDGSFDSNSALALRKAAIAGVGIETSAGRIHCRRPCLGGAGAHSSAIRDQAPSHRFVRAIAAYPSEGAAFGFIPGAMVQKRTRTQSCVTANCWTNITSQPPPLPGCPRAIW
jgi:DNA-binding transcriptional LysR family regulator